MHNKQIKFDVTSLSIFILIITTVGALTDVSLTNCPSYYLTSTPVETQNGFVDNGKSLYSGFQSQSNKESLYRVIIQGDTGYLFDYAKYLFTPYVIVIVIFCLVMSFVVLWCLFSRSCPPWQWTKRDILINPYTRKQMRYTLFWLLLFSIGILILSVFILSEIPDMKTNMQDTQCSLFVTLDTALNGDGNNWKGFQTFKDNIGNISSLISSTSTQIGLYFTGDDWLLDQMTLMKSKNNVIYEENKNSQLISPNPDKTQTQQSAGFPAPLIDSLFINKGLGPIGENNTMTTLIQQGLNVTEKLSDQASLVDQSAQFLDDSSQTIKSNFVLAQNVLNMYIYQLQVEIQELTIMSDQYFVGYFSSILYTIQIIISVCLVGTMLTLIGSFSTAIFRILQCRKMVHLGWVIFSFSFVGGLILMYIFISLGSVGYGFCEYYDGFLNGDKIIYNIKEQNSQNILNRIDRCLYGDGNVLQSFGVADEIKTLQKLFVNIMTYDDYTNTSSVNYVNTSFSINTINKWISNMENYKLGIFIDSDPAQTNSDNPNYSLSQLNLYSNTGGGVPTCSKDRWVFDKTNCTDPGEQTYVTSDQTNGGSFTTNKVLCISFNQGYAQSYNRSWNQQDFTKRYVQIRQNCPAAYNNIIKYGDVLINYRDSRINLFQGIQDSLNDLLTQNTDFNSMLDNFRSRVTQFQDSTKTLKNLIISQSSGIVYSSNCSVIGSRVKDTHTVFCRNFMSQIVRLGILSIILTILILFGIWAGSLFAVRYAEIQKNQLLNMPESQQDSERVISDKKSDESD